MFQIERMKVVKETLSQIRDEMWQGYFDENTLDCLGLSAEIQCEINRINHELNELLEKEIKEEGKKHEDS